MSETLAVNAAQAAFWNEVGGPTWVELSDLLDRQIEPVGLRAMQALAPRAGERLLDIGCGAGQTSRRLAEQVGPLGAVTGLDISRPLLDEARRRATEAGNLSFVEADAQTYAFEPASYDALYSRFGVMFFEDPKAAFGNLLRALKPGGRLAFVCWRTMAENPLMTAPLAAAARHLPPPQPPPPGAPGPFAFGDAAHVQDILAAAGFTDIAIEPFDTPIGGNSLQDSLRLSQRVGPLGALLREHPRAAPSVLADLRAALAAHLRDGAVWMDGAVWIVTARRP